MREGFFQECGSKTKTYGLCRGGAEGLGGDEQNKQNAALVHMNLPHENQYSSPDLPVEQRRQRSKIQKEDCETACVQRRPSLETKTERRLILML